MAVRYDPKLKSWYFVIDLPRGEDGKRRQLFRRGFTSEKHAAREEQLARQQFGQTDLAADDTVAAELMQWLQEREIDVAATTLSNYRNAIMKYVIPFLGSRQLYALDKRAVNDLYRHIMELLRNYDSERPHLLMSSSLIDAVRTHLSAEVDLPVWMSRRWVAARCGSGCAARATMWPAVRSASDAYQRMAGRQASPLSRYPASASPR